MSRMAFLAIALTLTSPLRAQPSASAADVTTPTPRDVVGPPRGQPASGAVLEERTKRVSALLRCPVCQGLSVADSPSVTATNMRAQVREMLAEGYDQDQVLSYFERSYGEFVRLEPPLRGVNWLVWFAPLLGLVTGGILVAWALRRPRLAAPESTSPQAVPDQPTPERDTLPEDPALHRYVLTVRELAYGWPGGVRPRAQGS